jgi:hypothetical protein
MGIRLSKFSKTDLILSNSSKFGIKVWRLSRMGRKEIGLGGAAVPRLAPHSGPLLIHSGVSNRDKVESSQKLIAQDAP